MHAGHVNVWVLECYVLMLHENRNWSSLELCYGPCQVFIYVNYVVSVYLVRLTPLCCLLSLYERLVLYFQEV